MAESTYAVVSYLSGPIAQFVSDMRRRLDPLYGNWQAHVSLLPPRKLTGTLQDLDQRLSHLRQVCRQVAPFEVSIEGVSTFWPVNGVVYLGISSGYEQLVELHNILNSNWMYSTEVYTYVPHVTIAQALDEMATQRALEEVHRAWTAIAMHKPVRFRVESLILVQQIAPDRWMNVAAIPLRAHALTTQN